MKLRAFDGKRSKEKLLLLSQSAKMDFLHLWLIVSPLDRKRRISPGNSHGK
jgi:hypothetical protein